MSSWNEARLTRATCPKRPRDLRPLPKNRRSLPETRLHRPQKHPAQLFSRPTPPVARSTQPSAAPFRPQTHPMPKQRRTVYLAPLSEQSQRIRPQWECPRRMYDDNGVIQKACRGEADLSCEALAKRGGEDGSEARKNEVNHTGLIRERHMMSI